MLSLRGELSVNTGNGAGSRLSYKLAYTSANETYGFKGEKEWYEWLKAWKKQIEEPVQVSVSVMIR